MKTKKSAIWVRACWRVKAIGTDDFAVILGLTCDVGVEEMHNEILSVFVQGPLAAVECMMKIIS